MKSLPFELSSVGSSRHVVTADALQDGIAAESSTDGHNLF